MNRFATLVLSLCTVVIPAASASSYFECKLIAVVVSVDGAVLAPGSRQESRQVTLTFDALRDGPDVACTVSGPITVPLSSGEPGKLAGLTKDARIAVSRAIIFPSHEPGEKPTHAEVWTLRGPAPAPKAP
ncbi:MAG: hypothetical protein IV100_20140 [Myxococcales bacterium]|nr:hypothetical protein [Myxococcales bacterium]